jgi:[ribosomal protein S5]-alanine N-acetyltransferase
VAKVVIPTASLDLVLQTPDEVMAWVESLPAAVRAEISPVWLARVRESSVGDYWSLGFTVVERESGGVVGGCFFKGPPDGDGVVELAYGIDPPYRGRGYATQAAEGLTAFALETRRASLVRAHTKPDGTASMRVLTKCGFRLVGEVIDPEDGLVCRWEHK